MNDIMVSDGLKILYAGFHEDAIHEHKEEIHFSEIANNMLDVAIGNRKVGERLADLGKFEEALHHQEKHLKISKSLNNLLEQQRALATIGHTHYRQACNGFSIEQIVERNRSLLKAQEAFARSLDVCKGLTSDQVCG